MNTHDKKTIAAWRLLRGDMTQQELAVKAHLHTSTINVTENGTTTPSVTTLRRIAEALGVGMDQIELPEPRVRDGRTVKGGGDKRKRKRRGPKPRTQQAPQAPQTPDEADDTGDDPKAWARTAA